MENKFVPLKEDKARLLKIFISETEDGADKDCIVYSHKDKRIPPNAIFYYHDDSVQSLSNDGAIKILDSGKNIDETAPNFVGPIFYKVRIIATKINPNIKTCVSMPHNLRKYLPDGVKWDESDREYILKFGDGKHLTFSDKNAPNAIYFRILIDNYEQPVYHDEAMKIQELVEAIQKKAGQVKRKSKKKTKALTPNEHIYSLVKTLRDKIFIALLQDRIKLESKAHGYYILTVTSGETD